jgi:hypothetical protein
MQTIAKTTFRAIIVVLTTGLVYLTACERSERNPQSPVATKTISAQGGSVSTADNQVTVTLPAGAVSASTEVAIEKTSEVAPKGIGNVYRITPEGTTFGKPVTISFVYSEADAQKVNPALMAVAYQKQDGSWQKVPLVAFDEKTRTLTVQSNHFSLWSLIEAQAGLSIYTQDLSIENTPADIWFDLRTYRDDEGRAHADTSMAIQTTVGTISSFFMSMDYQMTNKYVYQFNDLKLTTTDRKYFYNADTGDVDSTSVRLVETTVGEYSVGTFAMPVYSYPLNDTTRIKFETLTGEFRLKRSY